MARLGRRLAVGEGTREGGCLPGERPRDPFSPGGNRDPLPQHAHKPALRFSHDPAAAPHARRVLLFPKGNGCDFLSLYLDVPTDFEQLQVGWVRRASFTLTVVSSKDATLNQKKGARRAAPRCRTRAR